MSVQAAVVSAPGEIALERFPDPGLKPGEALVRMELSGICGTDKHIFRGEGTLYGGTFMETRPAFPVIPGHENVGVVEETGGEARDFYGRVLRPGDRIVMCPDVVCGHCWWCRHGRMLWCENVVCYGVTLGCEREPHLFGGWAERMVLRADAFAYTVPESVPPELAVLVEPLVVTAVLDEARGHSYVGGEGFRAGDTVVVQGAGPLGLMFVLRARVTGAGDVIVADSSRYRLELAERVGATHTISLTDTAAEERIARVRELTGGRGADVVIDCAGVPAALAEGLEMARKGGAYIETGAYVETGTAEISPHRHLCSKSIRLIGSTNHPYTGYGPALKLLELYGESAGFGQIVTHTMPLADARGALEASLTPDSGKVLITPA